jgi:hypothetical protein
MLIGLIAALAASQSAAPVRAGLEPLAFLVGHCWTASFPKKPGESDTQCFEAVFEGQHIRSRHHTSGSATVYRGETLFSYNGGGVIFTYWNSLGGVSRGTMTAEGDRLNFGDESYTGPDGRKISFSTTWRRVADDAYEAVTTSPQSPSLNRTMRYQRVHQP